MHRDESEKAKSSPLVLQLTLFLLVAAGSFAVAFLQKDLAQVFLFLAILPATLWLYLFSRSTWVPALFFVLHAASLLFAKWLLPDLQFFIQPHYIIAILAYCAVLLLFPRLRMYVHWFRAGSLDRLSWILIALMTVFSAIALALWATFVGAPHDFLRFVPRIPLWLLLLYGLLFPVLNALFEEFLARGVLYDGLMAVRNRALFVIPAQALLFALWHYQGFPGGALGCLMVFVWSIFLGILRHRSGGMLAPLIAHFFADLSIGIILFVLVIYPAGHYQP